MNVVKIEVKKWEPLPCPQRGCTEKVPERKETFCKDHREKPKRTQVFVCGKGEVSDKMPKSRCATFDPDFKLPEPTPKSQCRHCKDLPEGEVVKGHNHRA